MKVIDGKNLLFSDLKTPGHRMPDGYKRSLSGIQSSSSDVLYTPMAVIAYGYDSKEHEYFLLQWKSLTSSVQLWVPRSVIMSAGKLASSYSHMPSWPIGSFNSNQAMRYLVAYYEENAHLMERKKIRNSLGWHGNEFHTYTDDGNFCIAGDIERELIREVSAGGTLDGWLSVASTWAKSPVYRTAMLASLSSMLLKDLSPGRNFIYDMSWCTSSGKTIALEFAASVWGRPRSKFMTSWSDTVAATENRAEILRDLPLIVDETTKADVRFGPDKIKDMVHWVCDGFGKSRSSGDGTMQRITEFRSPMITCGETTIVETEGIDGGVAARCVCAHMDPGYCTDRPRINRQENTELQEKNMVNYGHVGPLCAKHYAENRPKYAGEYDTARNMFCERLEAAGMDQGAAGRQANVYGLLYVADLIITSVLTFLGKQSWEPSFESLMKVAESTINVQIASINRSQTAHEDIWSYLIMNQNRIIASTNTDENPESKFGEWLGKEMPDGSIAVHYQKIKTQLKDYGYNYGRVLRDWKLTGRIITDSRGKTTRPVWFCGQKTRMLVINPPNTTGD